MAIVLSDDVSWSARVTPLLADAWFAATSCGEAATAPAGSASTCATALSSANGSPARPAHLRTFAAGLR